MQPGGAARGLSTEARTSKASHFPMANQACGNSQVLLWVSRVFLATCHFLRRSGPRMVGVAHAPNQRDEGASSGLGGVIVSEQSGAPRALRWLLASETVCTQGSGN